MQPNQEKIERDAIRRKVLIAVILLILGIGFGYVNTKVLQPKYQDLTDKIQQTSTLVRKINTVEAERDNYEQLLSDSGKAYGNLITNKDTYIEYIGETTMANKLNINKMTVDDIQSIGNQMYSMKVDLEVEGDLYNVKNMIQQLYDSETVSRINSFSYRLKGNGELQWMWREIDDRTLVDWWTLQGDSNANTSTTNGEEDHVLGADDLLTHGKALCYLEIEFLGTGG